MILWTPNLARQTNALQMALWCCSAIICVCILNFSLTCHAIRSFSFSIFSRSSGCSCMYLSLKKAWRRGRRGTGISMLRGKEEVISGVTGRGCSDDKNVVKTFVSPTDHLHYFTKMKEWPGGREFALLLLWYVLHHFTRPIWIYSVLGN